ncbi:MAG: GGDEF domain-containing protein, partial [Erysipelotrichaceae bacterium]|nr:GGDEF domain-containing protein [Erysipelotrichaceae bacterium]
MIFYCAVHAILMASLKLSFPLITSVLFIAAFALVLYLAYHNNTKLCYYMEMILILAWVIFFVRMFGWPSGAQYLIFLLIIYVFITSHILKLYKYLICVLLCLIFVALYVFCNLTVPVYQISKTTENIMQICSIITVCFSLAVIISLFSSEALQQEGKLMEYNEKVTHLASIDPLTGLINRRSTKDQIGKLIDAGREEVPFLSLAMGDIDFFKKINDTYGHEGGDVVLKGLAECFMKTTEDLGYVCRWGGEEFLFLLPNMNGDEAYDFIEKLRIKVKKIPFNLGNDTVYVSMTFGVQEHDFRVSIDESIDEADKKLYL